MLNIVVVSWVLYTTVVWLLLLVGNRTDMQEALLNHKSAATVDWYVLMLCLSTQCYSSVTIVAEPVPYSRKFPRAQIFVNYEVIMKIFITEI